MRASYESFRQGLDPSMILEAASSSPPGGHDDFYSKLVLLPAFCWLCSRNHMHEPMENFKCNGLKP